MRHVGGMETIAPSVTPRLSSLLRNIGLPALAVLGLAVGLALRLTPRADLAPLAHQLATLPVLAALIIEIVRSLSRGEPGLDIVAALSMTAALAFGEPLAGNVVAIMYAGGQLLERFAEGRARAEMTALMNRVARTALRHEDGRLVECSIEAIHPGDRLLIRKGEVLPVDGTIESPVAVLDMSALTGESLPETRRMGEEALSGAMAAGGAFDLRVSRAAGDSTYAGIVKLVAAAQAAKAPMARMADRYAIGFLFLTLLIAGVTYALTGETARVLSVLVVATPCPLILAVPVAIMAGLSRAAKAGALIKGGGVLERLAGVRTLVTDKTGTLTHGVASLSAISPADGIAPERLLQLAASLDQASGHVVAEALIAAATERALTLHLPARVSEQDGSGLEGEVDGHHVRLGGEDYVAEAAGGYSPPQAALPPGTLTVAVAVDGRFAGRLLLQDRLRTEATDMLAALRKAGIDRIVLASGDRPDIAEALGERLGLEAARGGLSPEAKVALVRDEAARAPVLMVGDGVNDAPALALADVGAAMGARGSASSSEAADMVLLVDDLRPLAAGVAIARRTKRIALESVVAGLGLSVAAMIAAGFGLLSPVEGAILQEVIDVAVILNALRVLN